MNSKSFDITINGIYYVVDIVEGDFGDVELFIERDQTEDEEIPDSELYMVTKYLVAEGFVNKPE